MNLSAFAEPVTHLPGKVTSRCLLDSAESRALLIKHNIRLSDQQIATFRNVESHW